MTRRNGHLYHRHILFTLGIHSTILVGLLGCRGPELRIHSQGRLNEPMVLMVRLPDGPDQAAREKNLRDNLNTTLQASHALVLAEDRKERDPILWIEIQEVSRGDVSKNAVSQRAAEGAVTGTREGFVTGVESVAASNHGSSGKHEAKDDLAFVVVTTVAGAAIGTAAGTLGGLSEGVLRGTYHDARLGYRPKHLICTVSYAPDGTTPPRQIGSTDAWAVLKEMRPMSNGDAHDIQQLHKEEARALAIVVNRILERAGTM